MIGRRASRAAALGLALLAPAAAAADDIERLVELLRLREDIESRHAECIAGANRMVEGEVDRDIHERYADLDLAPDDLALLVAIYSEYYLSGCNHLAGDEVLNFYRAEFRRRFSAAEIDALIAFYDTPLGARLNAQWLEINRLYGETLQQRQAVDGLAAQRRYEQRMAEFWRRLERRAIEPSPERGASARPSPPVRAFAATGPGAHRATGKA